MVATTKAPVTRSAVGNGAMLRAMSPAIIINPEATQKDLLCWAAAELENLHTWLDVLACSDCAFDIEPNQLAGLVAERVRPLVQGLNAALECGVRA